LRTFFILLYLSFSGSLYNDIAFMSITAHWIDINFEMNNVLMDFIELHGSHSGVNIENVFSNSLITYKVFDKKLAVTLDNASNNNAFIAALMERDPTFDREHHIRCFGHVLNLTAQDALRTMSDEIN